MRKVLTLLIFISIFSCSKDPIEETPIDNPTPQDSDTTSQPSLVFDLPADSAPHFVDVCYIDLQKIERISRFRSGIGHDYSDDFEFCRSMKHYFAPFNNSDSVGIYSPVKGEVVRLFQEWAGYQLQIKSTDYPAFSFVIFHVNLLSGIQEGTLLVKGQLLGYHVGNMTSSDIAVKVNTSTNGPKSDTLGEPNMKLFSIFNLMNDSVFNLFTQRGILSREQMIITEDERDASPLNCNGETFLDQGILQNWIDLQ